MSANDRLPDLTKKREFREPKPEELKEENPVPVREEKNSVPEPQISVLRSEFDGFISDRLRAQPKTLEEVEAKVVEKPKDGVHQLSLPEEMKEYEKKYAFCWIFKRKKSVDEACVLYHWVLCNKTYFPDVAQKAPHIFSANGVIERGDEILMFRSKKVDEYMRQIPGIESSQRIKNQTEAHLDKPGFYIPNSEEWETDPRTGKRVKVPIVGV